MPTSRTYSTGFGYEVSVEIVRDVETDTAYVDVIAPCYKIKQWRMPHCYAASAFSDHQILCDGDFTRVMFQHYPATR